MSGSTSGTAWRSPAGRADDIEIGFDGMPGGESPSARGPGDRRHLRRHQGLVALHPQRAQHRRPALGLQARLAGPAPRRRRRWLEKDPSARDRAHGRLEYRAVRRGRLEHGVLRGQVARRRPASAPPSRGSSTRVSRTSSARTARPGHLHLLGLPAAPVPQEAGDADRLRPRLPGAGHPGRARRDRPRGAQGQDRRPTTRRSSWSSSTPDRHDAAPAAPRPPYGPRGRARRRDPD